MCLDVALAQIATSDLDISVVGQLLAANFRRDDEVEPGPVRAIPWRWTGMSA
jgi:hypothetical protein